MRRRGRGEGASERARFREESGCCPHPEMLCWLREDEMSVQELLQRVQCVITHVGKSTHHQLLHPPPPLPHLSVSYLQMSFCFCWCILWDVWDSSFTGCSVYAVQFCGQCCHVVILYQSSECPWVRKAKRSRAKEREAVDLHPPITVY